MIACITAYMGNGWQVVNQLEYTSYAGRPAGLNSTVALWSMSVSRFLFKRRQGEIKVMVRDILNQICLITHTVTPLMIQDSRSIGLTRYALVSFLYNFRDIHEGVQIHSHE